MSKNHANIAWWTGWAVGCVGGETLTPLPQAESAGANAANCTGPGQVFSSRPPHPVRSSGRTPARPAPFWGTLGLHRCRMQRFPLVSRCAGLSEFFLIS